MEGREFNMKLVKKFMLVCLLCVMPIQNVEAKEINQSLMNSNLSICICDLFNVDEEVYKCVCENCHICKDNQDNNINLYEHNSGPR